MKYGCFERPENRLNFRLHMLERNVIIEVSHPTSASASRHLGDWIKQFSGSEDIKIHFKRTLKSSKRLREGLSTTAKAV